MKKQLKQTRKELLLTISSVLLTLVFFIAIVSGCFMSALRSHYRSLPNELYEKTEHFIPKGKADNYWLDDGGMDGFIIRQYTLNDDDTLKLNMELRSQNSKWKQFEGEHIDLFEGKYGDQIYLDEDTQNIRFRDGKFYYCNCDANDFSYFNILEDTFLIHPSWFFVYDIDSGIYYAILC